MSSVRLGRSTTRRNIRGGLPPGPRARSVGNYDGREREVKEYRDRDRARDSDQYPRHDTGASARAPPPTRSMRPQRSVANIPSRYDGGSSSYTDVSEVPPLPQLPRRSDVSSKSSATSGSYSSTSGFSSTFLDRMKGRREYGDASSSRTSLDEEADPPRKVMGPEKGGWVGQRTAAMPEPEYGAFRELQMCDVFPRRAHA